MTSPAWDSLHQYAADDLNVGARPKFLCDQCNRGFQRVEHLKRHRRCHSPEYRPFFCDVCSKGFSRSDTLNRHRLIHDCSDSCAGLTPPNEECAKPQPNRACYACAKARAKCSKGEVCSRCLSRSIPCVYPSSRKRRRRPDDFPQDGPSTDEIEGETDASTMYSASPEALMRQETADSRFTGALERCSLSRQREEHFAKMPKLAPVPNDMGEFQAHLQSQNQNQNQEICAQTARMSLDAETFLAGGTVTGVPAVFSHQESRSRYLAPAHYIKLNPNRHGEIASFELCFGDELYGEDFNSPTNWETPNLEPDMAGMSPVSMDNGSFALLPESDYSIQQAMPFNQSNAPVGYFQKNMGGNQFCRAAARYEQQANSDLPYPVCAPQQAKCSGGGWGLQRRRTDPYIPQPFVEQGATRPIASGASYQ